MSKIKWSILILVAMFSMQMNATTTFEGTLHCLPNEVQWNAQGEVHFGAPNTSTRYFLIRNQYDVPLIVDFPEGHIGASAGLTQRLAPRAWAVYVYKPNADGLRTDAGRKPPFWSCAQELPSGSLEPEACQQSIWFCALSQESAAKLLSASYQETADAFSHSFWLPLGNVQYQSVYFLKELLE